VAVDDASGAITSGSYSAPNQGNKQLYKWAAKHVSRYEGEAPASVEHLLSQLNVKKKALEEKRILNHLLGLIGKVAGNTARQASHCLTLPLPTTVGDVSEARPAVLQ